MMVYDDDTYNADSYHYGDDAVCDDRTDEERDIDYMMENWHLTREEAERALEDGAQGDIMTERNERWLDAYLSSLE